MEDRDLEQLEDRVRALGSVAQSGPGGPEDGVAALARAPGHCHVDRRALA